MITRPVAVARGILAALVVWALGTALTYAAFHLMDARTTIKDVAGQADRVQIIWWGTHAFCACVAALLGTVLASSALTGAFLAEPGESLRWSAAPVTVAGALLLLGLHVGGVVGWTMTACSLVGLLIGVGGGCAFVLTLGAADDRRDPFAGPRRTTGQSWGSR